MSRSCRPDTSPLKRLTARTVRRQYAIAFLDQGASSATSFLFILFVGRSLGPGTLGVATVGLAASLLAGGLGRASIGEPAASSAHFDTDDARCALTASIALAVFLGASITTAGLIVRGIVGTALISFGPWIPFYLIHTVLRSIAYRNRKASQAAVSSLVWFATLPLAWAFVTPHSPETVATVWGLGASAATLCIVAASRTWRPARPSLALAWWRAQLRSLGMLLTAESLTFHLTQFGVMAWLTGIVGPKAVGGLRAVESLFSPLSLLGAAVGLPALPQLAQESLVEPQRALRRALIIGFLCSITVALYAASLAALPTLAIVFGEQFRVYSDLIAPVAIAQCFLAFSIGSSLYLRASRDGVPLLATRVGVAGVTLAIVPAAASQGIAAAAWAYAAVSAGAALVATLLAFRSAQRAHNMLSADRSSLCGS